MMESFQICASFIHSALRIVMWQWLLELTFGDGKDSQDQKGYWLHGEFVKPNSQPHVLFALFYKTDLYFVSRSLLLILSRWWKISKVVHSKNICTTPKTEKLPSRTYGPLFMHFQTPFSSPALGHRSDTALGTAKQEIFLDKEICNIIFVNKQLGEIFHTDDVVSY